MVPLPSVGSTIPSQCYVTPVHKSVCRKGKYVLRWDINSVDYDEYVQVEIACPRVRAAAHVVVADTLPVGVDFFGGKNLAGARVFPSSASTVEATTGMENVDEEAVCSTPCL